VEIVDAEGTIEVVVKHPRFAFVYSWFKPTIEIDGQKYKRRWGTYEFTLPSGSHIVSASYPWFLAPECGKNSVTVDLGPSSKIRVEYVARYIRYLPGKITVAELAQTTSAISRTDHT
jgi:hypothetical protein